MRKFHENVAAGAALPRNVQFPDISVEEIGFLEQFKATGYWWLRVLGWGATPLPGRQQQVQVVDSGVWTLFSPCLLFLLLAYKQLINVISLDTKISFCNDKLNNFTFYNPTLVVSLMTYFILFETKIEKIIECFYSINKQYNSRTTSI